ncbi:iron reductase domain protein, partial [Trichocladium antarcticum]
YTDINTNITFYGHAPPSGYRFGMVLPEEPTGDVILQIVAPLQDGAGWGGLSFGSSMIGPLLFATWPFGNRVMTAPRMAKNYTPAGVTLYTDHQMPLTTIKSGTFVNKTHISSTFRCRGCVNGDSFDPTPHSTRDVIFSYAYSRTAVANPGRLEARLSDHTATGGGYASFRVVLADAKSSEYDKYAAMA